MNLYKDLIQILRKSCQKYLVRSIFGIVQDTTPLRDKQTYFSRKVHKKYYTLYNYLQLYFKYSFLFNLFKAIVSITVLLIIYCNLGYDQLPYHLTIIIINSICLDSLKTSYNFLMLKKLKGLETFLDVGQALGYCKFIQNTQQLPYEKIPYNIQSSVDQNSITKLEISIDQKLQLMKQLKNCYHNSFKKLRNMNNLSILLYQGFGILIFYMSMSQNWNVIMDNQLAYSYILFSKLVFVIQYLNFIWSIQLQLGLCAIILMVFIISAPFVLFLQILKFTLKILKKNDNTNKKVIFQPKEFKENQYEGKMDCIICLQPLNNKNIIIELSCNRLHIFHNQCIKEWWIQRQQTCPFCRACFNIKTQQTNHSLQIY